MAIAARPVLYDCTKDLEIYCHFVLDKVVVGDIITQHIPSYAQVADIFIKQLLDTQHSYHMHKNLVFCLVPLSIFSDHRQYERE